MSGFVSKKEITALCVAITVAITSVVSAMVWVDQRIETHGLAAHKSAVEYTEFERYIEIQQHYNEQIIDRLQSIEVAIRNQGKDK